MLRYRWHDCLLWRIFPAAKSLQFSADSGKWPQSLRIKREDPGDLTAIVTVFLRRTERQLNTLQQLLRGNRALMTKSAVAALQPCFSRSLHIGRTCEEAE